MKSITIPCLDYELAADWYEGGGDQILLVLVGYSSEKAKYGDLVTFIVNQTGMSALVLDYGGHGKSPFELRDVSPAQNFLEVVEVFDWLREKYPNKKISVMGTSYGGFLAVQLIKYRDVQRTVLRVPAILKPEAFYDKWAARLDDEEAYEEQAKKYRTDKKQIEKHPLFARAREYNGKVFVVVHEHDELVPREVTDTYIEVFNADSYLAKDFPHSYYIGAPEGDKRAYKQAIADWLNQN